MSGALYTPDILRLSVETASYPRLPLLDASAERRAPLCGSRVCVDLKMDAADRVQDIGLAVSACAMGQASSAILAKGIKGQSRAQLDATFAGLRAFLSGDAEALPDWPGIEALAPARGYPARHGAILIPFEAALAALQNMQITQGDA